MTAPTFNPPRAPKQGTQDKPTFKILKAEFGDGYTQASPDGLNSVRRELSLGWEVLLPAEAQAIMSFILGLQGSQPFWYTPSDETTPVLWTCEAAPTDVRAKGGLREVNLVFKQSFNIV